ncbi:MAG: tRNA (guanosine(37)-N1)-methyltransferase TrmD [Patescibacteria group bacterium]|jgi:tRNA (guanine37-N1)-methyltransferase
MNFKAISIYPEIFNSYLQAGILKRAQDQNLISFEAYDLRAWSTDNYHSVDDTPYGGGAGMVMRADIWQAALSDIKKKSTTKKRKVVMLSARGETWTQAKAQEYSKLEEIVFVCGRFEGIDERVRNFVDEEISVGDYVLTGGELPALIIMDSVSRLLPDVLGNSDSLADESHAEAGVLEYPQYTKPPILEVEGKKYPVPEILLSGDHAKIAAWRKAQRQKK